MAFGALPLPVSVAPDSTGQGMLSRMPGNAGVIQSRGQIVGGGGATQNQYAGDAAKSAAISQIQDPLMATGASLLSQTSPWFGVNLGNALMQSSGSMNAGQLAAANLKEAQAKAQFAGPVAQAGIGKSTADAAKSQAEADYAQQKNQLVSLYQPVLRQAFEDFQSKDPAVKQKAYDTIGNLGKLVGNQ